MPYSCVSCYAQSSTLDPYTFADDLAEDIADESEQRSAEEVLLATIDTTADDKLTRFAIRLALSGHVGIPRENEPDFLTEAEAVFVPPQPTKAPKTRGGKLAAVPAAKKKLPAQTKKAAA